jgi:hypothetical protein
MACGHYGCPLLSYVYLIAPVSPALFPTRFSLVSQFFQLRSAIVDASKRQD